MPEDNAINRSRPAPEQLPAPTPPPESTQEQSELVTASALTQPPPAITAPTPTPTPQRESFWRFFVHHIQTDPQARLCEQYFYYHYGWPKRLFRRDVDVILPYDYVSSHYDAFTAVVIHNGNLFLVLVPPNRQVGSTRKSGSFEQGVPYWYNNVSIMFCLL